MGATAYGGEMNAYVIRQYVSKLQEQWLIRDQIRIEHGELPLRQKLNNEQRTMLRWG
jgi:hypothetical protein